MNQHQLKSKLLDINKNPTGIRPTNKDLIKILPYIEEFQASNSLESIKEAIYHIVYSPTDSICTCNKKKPFQINPKRRYYEYCSIECSKKYFTPIEDLESNLQHVPNDRILEVKNILNNLPLNFQLSSSKYKDIRDEILWFMEFKQLKTPQESTHYIRNIDDVSSLTYTGSLCPVCKENTKIFSKDSNSYLKTCSKDCGYILSNSEETREKKSKSCSIFYKNNPQVSKDRGIKVKEFHDNLKEEDMELYNEKFSKQHEAFKEARDKRISYSDEANKIRSEKGKIMWENFSVEKQNEMVSLMNEGFKNFLNNMSEEESKLYFEKSIPKRRKTNEESGFWITEEQVKDFKDYSKLVWRYTNNQPLHILDNIEKRGHANQGKYHLDHKFSIFEGYLQDIPAEIIGNICNLEMVVGRNNLKKHKKCSISLDELLKEFYE